MQVSLIFTVLNEAKSIGALLDTLAAQTRRPDEIVVCDGGSSDDTVKLLRAEQRLNIRVIVEPGANISRGRNIAIAAATHDLIACTDAGVRLDPQWLEKLIAPFEGERLEIGDWRLEARQSPISNLQSQSANPQSAIENPKSVSAGFFLPDAHTTFEMAMSATVLPQRDDISPATFLPSSRSVAFTKQAWQQVGGYPEWLDYCEDLIFDLRLRHAFGAYAFAPEAIAYFKPRSSLRSFYKQYYLYARGDGKANLFLKRHLIRYATYLVALPALLIGLIAGALPIKLLCAMGMLAGFVIYTRTPYRRLAKLARDVPAREKLKAALLVPVIRVVGDVAKMAGYPAGVVWRLRNQSPKWQ
jgi:glycosyltransferase involved in cell wall biosynthesis